MSLLATQTLQQPNISLADPRSVLHLVLKCSDIFKLLKMRLTFSRANPAMAVRSFPLIHRQVAGGRERFPADVVDAAMERETGRRVQSRQLVKILTPRERQVVVSLCEGNSNKKIARQLNVTEGTVKVHLSNIYNKLGVANRTALTALTIVHRD